jgi:putative chitobiose transport system substrate-binding protein
MMTSTRSRARTRRARRLPATLALLAATISLLVGLGACDRANAHAARSTSPGDASATTRLEFWTLALKGRPELEAYIADQLARFERDNPGVKVDWVDVPFSQLDRKLLSAAAADRMPDLVNLSDKTYGRFIAAGALADMREPLAPLAGAEGIGARYLPGAFGLCVNQGRVLALPWYLTTQTLLANEPLLKQGGMSVESLPRDWAGLREAARAYRKAVGPSGPYLFTFPMGHDSDLLMMLFQEGLPPVKVGPEGRLVSNLRSPEVVRVIADWVAIYREDALPREAATLGGQHVTNLYKNKRVAVVNYGPNFMNVIRKESPEVYEATRTGAPVTGPDGRGHIAVMVLGVMERSEHKDLAAKLAWSITSPASQEAFCRVVPILPSTRASLDEAQFSDEATATRLAQASADATAKGQGRISEPVAAKTIVAGLDAARSLRTAVAFTPSLAAWPDMRRTFEDRIKRAMAGEERVEDSLAWVDAEWSRMLRASPAGADALPSASPTSR